MATTAATIIQAALEEIGVYSPGETLDADDQARALAVLNNMMDSWSNEGLLCYEIQERSVALTIGTNSYTIGSGGVINDTRPLSIRQAYIRDGVNNRFDMRIVPRDIWNRIGNVSSNITSQIPSTLFYDPQFPLGVINIFPTPLAAYTLFYDNLLLLTTFALVTTALSAPPGYEDAIQHNLAVRLGPYFREGLVSQDVKDLAAETKAAIKRTNIPEIIAKYDQYIVAHSYATYNIYRDTN